MAKVKKEGYKLPNPLVYRLNNPNYTIYHRAALGGLASTMMAWGENQPEGITAKVDRDEVTLSWDGKEILDQEFLRKLIESSFRLTDDKIIDLPGQRLDIARDDLRLAVHNGLRSVFLQHTQTYKAQGVEKIELKIDNDTSLFLTYQKITEYAHKNEKKIDFLKSETVPTFSTMAQWMIPGVIAGAENIQRPTEEILLLMFLIVSCPIFQVNSQLPKIRAKSVKERKEMKIQSCMIVPNVVDLIAFVKAIAFINAQTRNLSGFSNNYLNRVVGGAEEAGIRFLLDLEAEDLLKVERRSVDDCVVVAMGKVAWVSSQMSRSHIAKVRGDYEEINVFSAARQYLGMSKVIKLKSGDSLVIPASPVPELIAANLANNRHWCSDFISLVSEKKDFQQMLFAKGGLQKMKNEIKDEEDKLIIDVFHDAWNNIMGEFWERSQKGEFIFDVKVENEKEKMRNAILRAKTSDALASWFLRFCADASKQAPVKTLQSSGEQARKFIFNSRNFERFKNLCLFALVSYASKRGENKNQNPQNGGNQ